MIKKNINQLKYLYIRGTFHIPNHRRKDNKDIFVFHFFGDHALQLTLCLIISLQNKLLTIPEFLFAVRKALNTLTSYKKRTCSSGRSPSSRPENRGAGSAC